MFVREIKAKNKSYIAIVENYREKGKVKQRCLVTLGRLDKLVSTNQIKNVALSLLKYCKEKNLYDITKLREKERYKWGIVFVVRKMWNKLNLDEILNPDRMSGCRY